MQKIFIDKRILPKVDIKYHLNEKGRVAHIDFRGKTVLLCFISLCSTVILSNDLYVSSDGESVRFSITKADFLNFGTMVLGYDIVIADTTIRLNNVIQRESTIDQYTIIIINNHCTDELLDNLEMVSLFGETIL